MTYRLYRRMIMDIQWRRVRAWIEYGLFGKLHGHWTIFGDKKGESKYALTIFGWNAMHFAWVLKTPTGYWHFRPPSFHAFRWNCFVLYKSPNGTPYDATWMFAWGGGWDYGEYLWDIKRIKMGMTQEQYCKWREEQLDNFEY